MYPRWRVEMFAKAATAEHAIGERILVHLRYWPVGLPLPEEGSHDEAHPVHRGTRASAREVLEAMADKLSLRRGDVLDLVAEELWARLETEFRATNKSQADCVYAAVTDGVEVANEQGVCMARLESVVKYVRGDETEDQPAEEAHGQAKDGGAMAARQAEWKKPHPGRPEVREAGTARYRFVSLEVGGNHRFLLANGAWTHNSHHSASSFRILEKPAFNILAQLQPAEYRAVRTRLTLGILATDMTSHFSLIEKFNGVLDDQAKLAAAPPTPISPTTAARPLNSALATGPADMSDAHRQVVFNVVLHSCDISNQAKAWPIQRKWSDAVLAEFLHQGDMERAKGLPISPNCDRATTDQAQLSLSFIDFIVAPIYLSLRQLLPAVAHCCRLIKDNRASWAAIFTESIASNPKLNADEKRAELSRATRRTESFHSIMMPSLEDDRPTPVPLPRSLSVEQLRQHEEAGASASATSSSGQTPTKSNGDPRTPVTPLVLSPGPVRASMPPLSGVAHAQVQVHDNRRSSIVMLKQFLSANTGKSSPATPTRAGHQ